MSELPAHISNTRSEPGCLIFEVTQNPNEKNVFSVYEEFADKQSFALHQARVKASIWGQVTANVERHYKINE